MIVNGSHLVEPGVVDDGDVEQLQTLSDHQVLAVTELKAPGNKLLVK